MFHLLFPCFKFHKYIIICEALSSKRQRKEEPIRGSEFERSERKKKEKHAISEKSIATPEVSVSESYEFSRRRFSDTTRDKRVAESGDVKWSSSCICSHTKELLSQDSCPSSSHRRLRGNDSCIDILDASPRRRPFELFSSRLTKRSTEGSRSAS